MIKMKSVPIIFLIFMFIILTIPAYAADTKKITSVNIQRIYKAKEGEINPDQVSFKPGRSEYTITYQGMYDASDLPIGSYMDYKITLNAKKGYDFEWLKERNCLSDSGTDSFVRSYRFFLHIFLHSQGKQDHFSAQTLTLIITPVRRLSRFWPMQFVGEAGPLPHANQKGPLTQPSAVHAQSRGISPGTWFR